MIRRSREHQATQGHLGGSTPDGSSSSRRRSYYKSLTRDRGKELTDHRRFTLATNIDVYFCDPQSPWQRGSNEKPSGEV